MSMTFTPAADRCNRADLPQPLRWRRSRSGKEPVASILTWTQKQQLERYPAIEKIYKVGTIKKGEKVSELPTAAQQIDPKVEVQRQDRRASTPS